jgi:release factor glutamine methyltransferase
VSRLLAAVYGPRLRRTDHAQVLGFNLEIPPGVFHPRLFFSSRILGGYLGNLPLRGLRVLDMGTGSGIQALCAARAGAQVIAVDINPAAVECARANAVRNHLQDIIGVTRSDLFSGIPEAGPFDLIAWNPPFYPREPASAARQAWDAGSEYAVIREFASQVRQYLSPSGVVVLILSSDMDEQRCLGFFGEFDPEPVLRRRRLFERLTVYRLRVSDRNRA